MSNPLSDLQTRLRSAAQRLPARVGIAIEDLATGTISGINANASMPAASTIKVPVMVEVFEQMAQGRVSLNKTVHLMASDRDWGWGELCDAPLGSGYSVSTLLVEDDHAERQHRDEHVDSSGRPPKHQRDDAWDSD